MLRTGEIAFRITLLISGINETGSLTSENRGTKRLARELYEPPWITNSTYPVHFGAYAPAYYTYIEATFYASWIFSGLLSSLPHSSHSGGINHRPTTLLVTEIALPRLLMGKGTRGIHRGFIEEAVIPEER